MMERPPKTPLFLAPCERGSEIVAKGPGGLEVDSGEIVLRDLVDRVLGRFVEQVQNEGVRLHGVVGSLVPVRVRGDAPRLFQALVTLVDDAIESAGQEEVILEVAVDALDRHNAALIFQVSTRVPGPPVAWETDIEPWVLTGSVHRLVAAMGGELAARSLTGQSRAMWFQLLMEVLDRDGETSGERSGVRPRSEAWIIGLQGTDGRVVKQHLEHIGLIVRVLSSALLPESIEEMDIRPVLLVQPVGLPHLITSPPIVEIADLGRNESRQALIRPLRFAPLNQQIARIRSLAEPASPSSPGRASELAGKRVLVVDDHPVNRKVALAMLRHLGVEADIARDGREAVARADQRAYDAVIMDCHMPVMDGFDATIAIRQDFGLDELPIVALTADATAGVRERCLECGMNDHLSKPLELDQLERMLLRLTTRRGQRSMEQQQQRRMR